ncbi:MAG: iron ABC transporter permease [Bryobacteraceae bacterium]|nr:iron ABC transporter permease [Bryobacteraceae bacterium]
MSKSSWLYLGVAAVIASAMLLPLAGSANVSLAQAWAGVSPDKEIVFDIRLPRVLLGLLAGGVLSVAGVLCQALLRDALATPYTLGVASGASLGAVTAICLGLNGVWLAGIVGAAFAVAGVVSLASDGGRLSTFTLLLAGVTLNSICLALILFLQSVTSFGKSLVIVRWLMGGIDTVEYGTLAWLTVLITPVLVLLLLRARDWNLLAVGEDWATARGVSAQRAIWGGYFAISILTGLVTAVTGPIGFVGLIVPHALRMKLGADHRLLLPTSFLYGAVFLAFSDTAGRLILAPAEIPVGVLTALLGGPFFILLLRSKRRSTWL